MDATPARQCSIDGCKKPAKSKGWCPAHYGRWQRNGNPLADYRRRPPGLTFEETFRWHAPDGPHGTECYCWPSALSAGGYGQFSFEGRTHYAHVASYLIYVGEVTDDLHVLHDPLVCNNRACVNPNHLRLGTNAENTADKHLSGTQLQGEHIFGAKMTTERVIEARRLYASGVSLSELSSRYEIVLSCIWKIVHRKSWKHVQ